MQQQVFHTRRRHESVLRVSQAVCFVMVRVFNGTGGGFGVFYCCETCAPRSDLHLAPTQAPGICQYGYGMASLPLLVAGMLLMGVLLRNIPVVTEWVYINHRWSSSLRNIALAVILTRAGLGLDPTVCISLFPLSYLQMSQIRIDAFCGAW